MRFLKALFVCLVTLTLTVTAKSQATGLYAFGPFDNPGFDTINRGNLNVHFSIPIFSKPGRGGSNFSYALNYDGLIWSPKSSNGIVTWTPAAEWGWTDVTNVLYGYITYNIALRSCTIDGAIAEQETYSGFTYHDNHGMSHGFNEPSYTSQCGNLTAPTGSGTYVTGDNSGLTIYRSGGTAYTVFTRDGSQFVVPVYGSLDGFQEQTTGGAATFTDTNGNQISASGTGIFTDTMGKKVLTASGSAPNPVVYTYTDSNGSSQTVTVNYGSYTVQTAFGVSGVSEYSKSSVPLVSSIVYSGDGSSYSFTYEKTPGNSSAVTGRIASITLRTGGVISYTYTGGNNGIQSDGTTSGLIRTTSDGSTTYARSGISTTQSNTSIKDALNNVTTASFLINSAGSFYETDHAVYNGTASGTPLQEIKTCYNDTSSSCSANSVASQFSTVVLNTYQNGTLIDTDTQTYAAQGLTQDQNTGVTTTNTYNTYIGPNNIAFYRLASAISSANGSTFQETTYGYDETTPSTFAGSPQPAPVNTPRGNLTSTHQWINSSGTTLNVTNAYDTTGALLTSTGPTGATTYNYDGSDIFTSSIVPPTPSSGVSLPTGTSYDANTGLLTSTTDPNGAQTTYKYTGMLDPLEVDNLDGNGNMVGKTYYNHESPNQVGVYTYQNASNYGGVEPLLDGYGRPSRTAVANGQATNSYYQNDYCYDADGRLSFHSYTYQGNGWSTPKVCSGSGDTYGYDALGRVKQITHADGTAINYVYTGRATRDPCH